MENLNKENFWNEMYSKYPNAMKDFCTWIDLYKKGTQWDKLFSTSAYYHKSSPKFHDLPLAIQMGIWNEYLDAYDIKRCKKEIENFLYATEEGMIEA